MGRGKIVLVTGGSRSGKSEFAEKMLDGLDDVLYIATAVISDDEMMERVEKHRSRRNSLWSTYEGCRGLGEVISSSSEKYIMLDCITILVSNFLFEKFIDFDNVSEKDIQGITDDIKQEIGELIVSVREKDREIIMVTNEVGCGIVPENRLSRIFRDIAGIINQYTASLCDEVYFVACGLPVKLK